jgi:hypothetical protein
VPSLCCFWCPAKDFAPRAKGDACPSCKRSYAFPLSSPPARIGPYAVLEPISRGFYGAAYRARQESIGRTVVLKIVPTGVYKFFGKDWVQECSEHARIAEGTPFVAAITDSITEDVDFGGAFLSCHVAVLSNIIGPTLADVLQSPDEQQLTPRTAAQLAADLFEILSVFTTQERFHNDLHAGNVLVQRLTTQTLRSGAIDPGVRAVAIDLGSVNDASLSGKERLGDHSHVARHIAALASAVHSRARAGTDVDSRIAGALSGLAEHLAPTAGAQRIMSPEDALRTLQGAIVGTDEPWRLPLSLARFGDAYNAQAMESWHVPEIWFDPENRWLPRTAARGPQVITGMRGCGKTILLRALHFHARATPAVNADRARAGLEQVRKDEFLGIYASCQKLLNPQDQGTEAGSPVPHAFERLFVAYLRDAVQVLRHLRALDATAVTGSVESLLSEALRSLDLTSGSVVPPDEHGFEHFLADLQFRLADRAAGFRLRVAPAEAFADLARVIRKSSPFLASKHVLFLLDDVSTRYLNPETVREVISQLLFQHPNCAFRITTETQALQRVLLSPGGSAPADPNRDYEEFDLGNEVYRLLQEGTTQDRMNFVSEILRRRGRQFRDSLYQKEPAEVLGDISLEDIAKDIAASSTTSPARKKVYRGLRALQAVCVGDLGDVVKLYEKILVRAVENALPVSAERQTECFLEHSASLMHFLNRRDQQKKALALAFAQASGELLVRSARNPVRDGRAARLRQYTKLYVRVDAKADVDVANRLLDLLDAGVFVYDGGVPRTKTRDNDPVLQFKLSYRKVLGLASFIGVSDRDRFELSGDALRQWLCEPGQAKRILLESESKAPDGAAEATPAAADDQTAAAQPPSPATKGPGRMARQPKAPVPQLQLDLEADTGPGLQRPEWSCAPALGIKVVHGVLADWREREVDTLVLPLGFEERALASAQRVLAVIRPRQVVLVRYGADQGAAIKRAVDAASVATRTVDSVEALGAILGHPGSVVVDSSGLSKPFLFTAVRDVLRASGQLGVIHTLAEQHYPRNEDLLRLGVTADQPVSSEVLANLHAVLTGETPPYRVERVHHAEGSPERWRGLIASASPKNDRLLHLLDARACDATRILVPPPTTPRRRLALAAVELAASAADANVALAEVDTNDVEGAVRACETIYSDLYFRSGANVELGLTGSKMHAVAFGALAAAARISYAWYVAPTSFDQQRFTQGVGDTQCFELKLGG